MRGIGGTACVLTWVALQQVAFQAVTIASAQATALPFAERGACGCVGDVGTVLTGVVTVGGGAQTAFGVGTVFQSELKDGDCLRIGANRVTVQQVISNTVLQLAAPYPPAGALNAPAFRDGDLMTVTNGCGATKLVVDQAGNVGIGTASPSAKLEIEDGSLLVRNALGNATFALDSAANEGDINFFEGGVFKAQIRFDADANGATFDFNDRVNGAISRMYVNGLGNVGIGTVSPNDRLHVSHHGTSNTPVARFENLNNNVVNNPMVTIQHGRTVNKQLATPLQVADGASSVVALVRGDGSAYFAGSVGIGTTSPSSTLHVVGSFTATGTKAATVGTASYRERKLYAVEAATVRFSDEGASRLERGSRRIDLDPMFAETIEGELLVHLTPCGPASLYVAEQGPDFFVARSLDGSDVRFAWQVSAARRGFGDVRLEAVSAAVVDACDASAASR